MERLRETGPSRGRGLLSAEQHDLLLHMEHSLGQAPAPLQQLEHALMPVVTFFVLPLFALANAGVTAPGGLVGSLRDPAERIDQRTLAPPPEATGPEV